MSGKLIRGRFIAVLLSVVILTLSLSACGPKCREHADTDGDGLCERCGAAFSEEEGEGGKGTEDSFDLPVDPFD